MICEDRGFISSSSFFSSLTNTCTMKRLVLFLFLWMAVLMPSVNAQTDTLIIADGGVNNSYIPIYGSQMNVFLHSQMIYPASMLEDMLGSTITSITFNTQASAYNYDYQSIMRVSLCTISANGFPTNDFATDIGQTVYVGTFSVVMGTMHINFDTGFVYTGGNLLLDIGTDQRLPGYHSASFKGMTTEDYVSIKGYATSSLADIGNQLRYKFLPKTTFVFSGGVTCLSPIDVEVDSVMQQSVQMIIHPRTGQTQWEYMVLEDGLDTSAGYWTTTADTVITLNGLMANTPYTLYVRTVCGSDASAMKTVSFHTDCLPIDTLPYTWDFETHATGDYPYYFPACWMRLFVQNVPYIYTTSISATSGNHILYFPSSAYNGANVAVVALPEIDTSVLHLNALRLEMNAKVSNQNHTCDIAVGTVVEQNNEWVFVPYDTIFNVGSSYTVNPYEVLFDQYAGSANRMAFRIQNTSSSDLVLCVDDVTVSEIPDCPNVQHMAVAQVAGQTVTVTWHGLSSSYLVRYRTQQSQFWADTVVTAEYIVLSGLLSNTSYVVQVAPDCEIVTEDMYRQVSFTTDCGPMNLPYLVSFDDPSYEQCWTVVQEGVVDYTYNIDAYYPAVGISSSNAYSGTKYLQMGADENSMIVLAAPKMASPIESMQMTFYARQQASSFFYSYEFGELQVGLMPGLSETDTFILLTTIPVTTTSYSAKSVDFSQYAYTGTNYHIAFRYLGFGYPDTIDVGCLYIDDIQFNPIASCAAPSSVSVSNVTDASATVSWTGAATSYHVYYKPMNEDVYQSMPVTANSTMSLSGLQSSTHYQYYVAAVCSDGTEAPSGIGEFMTDCGTHYNYPYVQNFDAYDQAMLPDCWQKIAGMSESGYYYPLTVKNTSYMTVANTPLTALAFASTSSQSATAILPLFSENLQQLRMYFSARPEGASSGTLKVGYITDPASSSSFVETFSLATENLTDYDYHDYMVEFSTIPYLDTAYIAFQYDCASDWAFFVDDVTVEQVPVCEPAIQLTSTTVLSTSANLSWFSNMGQVELYYKAASDTEFYSQTASLGSNGFFYVEGLTPATTYWWFVSSMCENQIYYSDTVSFTTDCAGITTLPQTWGFESSSNAGSATYPIPFCWHRIHNDYPYIYHSTLYNYAHTGYRALYFPTSSGNLYATIPAIDTSVLSLDTLQLKFYARVHSPSYTYTLEVGVMNDPMDYATFVPVKSFTITTASYQTLPYRVNFDQYQGTGTYIAFRCLEASSANVHIDDVTLQVKPDCEPVQNLTIDDITTSTALAHWTPEGAITDFVLSYKPSADTAWTTILVQDTVMLVSNLNPGTHYDIKVVPDCDDVQELATTFMTHCEPINTYPYVESFEGSFGCWYDSTIVANGSRWRVCSTADDAQYSQQGGYHLYFTPCYSNAHSAIMLISPVFDLSALTFPTITFYYDALGFTGHHDTLSLYYRTSPMSPWVYLSGYDDRDDYLVTWRVDTVDLPNASSSYQLAFMGSSSNGDGVYLDNVTVFDNLPLIQPTVETYAATNVTSQFAELNGAIVDMGNQTIMDQGFEWKAESDAVYTPVSVSGNTLFYQLLNLTPETNYTYHAFATTVLGTVTGQEMTFTTLEEVVPTCPAPTNLTVSVDHTEATLTWQQESNTADEWQINYRQTTEDNWSTATATSTTYTLTDLVANVDYEANVVAHCANGLVSDASDTITFETNNIGIQGYLDKMVTLYPNPAAEIVSVIVSDANVTIMGMEVYNVYGQIVETFHGTSLQGRATINVSTLSDGMYYVRVMTDGGVVTKNFVKR